MVASVRFPHDPSPIAPEVTLGHTGKTAENVADGGRNMQHILEPQFGMSFGAGAFRRPLEGEFDHADSNDRWRAAKRVAYRQNRGIVARASWETMTRSPLR